MSPIGCEEYMFMSYILDVICMYFILVQYDIKDIGHEHLFPTTYGGH